MLDFMILKRSNIIFLCVLPSLGFSFFVQRPLYCLLGHVTMFHWELYIHFLQCLLLEGNAKLNRFPKGSFGQSFWAFKTTFLKDGETKHLWWGRQRTLIRVKFQQPHLPIYQQPCYNWRYHFFIPIDRLLLCVYWSMWMPDQGGRDLRQQPSAFSRFKY